MIIVSPNLKDKSKLKGINMFEVGDKVMGYRYNENGEHGLVVGAYVSITDNPTQDWQEVAVRTDDGSIVKLIEHSVCWTN